MSDLISRSALIEKIKERTEMHSKDYQAFKNYSGDRKIKDIAKWDECEVIIDIAKALPTVEAKPVIHGEWLYHETYFFNPNECSVCGTLSDFKTKFCSECGADMRGKQNE